MKTLEHMNTFHSFVKKIESIKGELNSQIRRLIVDFEMSRNRTNWNDVIEFIDDDFDLMVCCESNEHAQMIWDMLSLEQISGEIHKHILT